MLHTSHIAFYVVSIAIFSSLKFILHVAAMLAFQMQMLSYIIVQNFQLLSVAFLNIDAQVVLSGNYRSGKWF